MSTKRQKVTGGSVKIYCCQYCEKSYKKPCKLEIHERSHTGEKPFVCSFPGCSNSYTRSDHLSRHEKTHQDTKEFECSFKDCTAAFKIKHHLRRHEKAHTAPNVKCDFPGCNAEFQKRYQLRWHKATHSTEKHHCEECSVEFKQLSSLEKHIKRVHENPIVYKCSRNNCDQVFKKWTELQKHVSLEHPSICTICNTTYTKRSTLKTHIREKHLEPIQIECEYPGCDSVLQSKRSYRTHVLTKHEQNNKHKCDICSKGFPYTSLLKKHAISHTRSPRASPSPSKGLSSPKKSIAEQITGHHYYTERDKYECPFQHCQRRFGNLYILRSHLEGKDHKDDVQSFGENATNLIQAV
ncbi:hypothetical protein K501DRAFT_322050 [Backusella circina FSU 941]|nr:hypothetical protein K501DRAFT_322050 [Backusella circina FSU 941]